MQPNRPISVTVVTIIEFLRLILGLSAAAAVMFQYNLSDPKTTIAVIITLALFIAQLYALISIWNMQRIGATLFIIITVASFIINGALGKLPTITTPSLIGYGLTVVTMIILLVNMKYFADKRTQ